MGLLLGDQDSGGSKSSYVDDHEEQQHIHSLTAQPGHLGLGLSTAQPCCQLLEALGPCKVCTTSDVSGLQYTVSYSESSRTACCCT